MGVGLQKKLLVVVMSLNCRSAFLFGNGYVHPVNPYGFINETLTLTCNVTSLPGNISGGLFFKLMSLINQTVKILPRKYVTPISGQAIQLDYPLTSRLDQGVYTCKLNETDDFIAEQRVYVEYRPRKVEKIDCRVFDWRNMTCTWDLGLDYINSDMVTSELKWEIKSGANKCPHSRETTCIWKETERDRNDFFRPHQIYYMQVTVNVHRKQQNESLLDTAASDVFLINPWNLVEPALVQSLTVGNRTSRCLSLLWNHKRHAWGLMYTVHVHQKLGSVLKLNTSEREVTVCDLQPAMTYTLQVACIPLENESGETTGFYSHHTSIAAKTLEDVPSGVPVVKTGSFVYNDCETSQCIATIYWRPIPTEESNGEITQYTIKHEDRQHGTSNVMKVEGSATSYDLKVRGDREYSITVTGETRVGVSGESKPIVIPACSKMPLPLDIVVEADTSTLYITWEVPPGSRDAHHGRVTGYTLFYCNGSKITSKCVDSIHWLPFASNIRQYEWKVPDGNLDNKMIGVSVEKETANRNVSSGIIWNTCVWRRNHKPPSPRGVTFSRHQPDNALSLEWRRLGCDESTVYVRYYVLSYCMDNRQGGCAGPSVVANVSNTEDSHVIRGLSAGVKYRVTLRAVSRTGEGPESEPITKLVENSDLASGQIAGISVGGVFGCVVLVSFVVCCVRKLRKTYRGLPLDIKLPTLTGVDKNDHITGETVTMETNDILKRGIQQKYPSSVGKHAAKKENTVDREGGVTPPTTMETDHDTSEKSRPNLETGRLALEIVNPLLELDDTPCSDRDKTKTSMKNKTDPSSIQVDSYLKLALSGNSKQDTGSDYVTRDKLSLLLGKSSCDASCDTSSHSSGQDTAPSPPPPYEPPQSPGDQKLETPPPTYSSYVSSQTDFPPTIQNSLMFCSVGDHISSTNSHPLSVLQQPPSSSPCDDTSFNQSQSHEESTSLQDHVTPKPQGHSTERPYIPFDKIQLSQPPKPPQPPQPPEEQKTVPPPADGYVSVSEASQMINKQGLEKPKAICPTVESGNYCKIGINGSLGQLANSGYVSQADLLGQTAPSSTSSKVHNQATTTL